MKSLLTCLLFVGVASATTYTIQEGGKVCFIADFTLNLDVVYPTTNNTNMVTVNFDSAKASGMCGKTVVLTEGMMNFTMTFAEKDGRAELESVQFDYSLEDHEIFKNAKPNQTARVAKNAVPSTLSTNNTYYQCSSLDYDLAVDGFSEESVAAKATGVKIQAFGVSGDKYTGEGQLCNKDLATTTPKTTMGPETTMGPKTTTAEPEVENMFAVAVNGTYCVVLVADIDLSSMMCGNFSVWANQTETTGSCMNDDNFNEMIITDKNKRYEITMWFQKEKETFQLHNMTVMTTEKCRNTLDNFDNQLEAPLANVYTCKSDQKFEVQNITVEMKNVKVQAFRTDNTTTLDAKPYICMADSPVSEIVPIAVGCALAGLIVIVLIAYIIGRLRRRPYEPV